MSALIGVLTVLLLIICVTLVGLILIQQGKGGGLVAFGGSGAEQAFGVHAATMAQKATAVLGITFIVLSIALGLLHNSRHKIGGTEAGPAPEAPITVPDGSAAPTGETE